MPPSPAPVLERYSRKPVAVTKRLRRLSMACPANRLFASFNNTSRPPDLIRSRSALIGCGDRKSVVQGKSVSVRVDLGGRRIIKKKINKTVRASQSKHNHKKQ